MKYFFILWGFGLLLSCSKDCAADDATCSEQPQTGVVCQAYFENWFFDESTKSCSYIGYSGCESLGFETQEACEECTCNEN